METLVIVFTIMFVSLYSFVSAKAGQIYVPMVTKGESDSRLLIVILSAY